ncbi:MAG: hypothetical protein EBU90_00910 [Proteobacteria bacterium]|nr:hypothetical protein [Pseudomonadota bacterium]NBP12993.1 hypothetical protein [bacterium]
MKDQKTIQAEEVAQKILGILDASANSKQWQEMVDTILTISEKYETDIDDFINHPILKLI